jgi:hypothetical protein
MSDIQKIIAGLDLITFSSSSDAFPLVLGEAKAAQRSFWFKDVAYLIGVTDMIVPQSAGPGCRYQQTSQPARCAPAGSGRKCPPAHLGKIYHGTDGIGLPGALQANILMPCLRPPVLG